LLNLIDFVIFTFATVSSSYITLWWGSNAYLSPHRNLLLCHSLEVHGDRELNFNILSLF
jgi:hypothetical protein